MLTTTTLQQQQQQMPKNGDDFVQLEGLLLNLAEDMEQ
jgi:hypothetical protein